MANYTKKFDKPYTDGYKDRPNTSTPVTAAIKNMETEALLSIEEFLSQLESVSIDGVLSNGYSIATITIDGETFNLNIPELSYTSAITGGTKIGQITLGEKSYDLYAPVVSAGGSNVSVTPKTSEGTNIAEITVDGTTYQLYAPAGGSGSGSTVTAEAMLAEGTVIGKITIDGVETTLYAPKTASVTVDAELSDGSENPVQNKVIAAKLNEVFQSVSNGKSLIASAITDKGVTTEADATFQTMAANIGQISGGRSVRASNAIEMAGISRFESKIALADILSTDQITLKKDSTDIAVTAIEKISETKFKLTADFSGIATGDNIKIQTAKGFLYDPDLTSVNDVTAKLYDERFLVGEPELDGTAYLTLLYTQASFGYYATKRAENTEEYWAIGIITYCGVYTVPLIVSDVSDYACVTSTYMGNTPTSTYTFEYDGKTYYCNSNVQGANTSSVAISNVSIPLYDVHDSKYSDNEAGCVYMAKKLLDFYYGKEEFPT